MRRRLVTMLGLTAVVVAGGLVAATPAHAVLGIQVVQATSASDSTAVKSVMATCPAPGVVYGGGGYVQGVTAHDVRLSGLRPMVNPFGLSAFQATATEDETGYKDDWAVTAFAICGPELVGYQVIWSTSPSSSDSSHGAIAACPAGKKVISAGAAVSNGGGDVVLQFIVPSNHLDRVTANAYEDETGYNGHWQLTAYAVCATTLSGLELVVGTSPAGEGSYKLAFADCPEGKHLLGLGGHAFGGVPGLGELYLNTVHGFQGDPWTAIVSARTDETGFPTGWFAAVYAICVY